MNFKPVITSRGQSFGFFTVLEPDPTMKSSGRTRCQCWCGEIRNVHTRSLLDGKIKSCGCWSRSQAGKTLARYNLSRRKYPAPKVGDVYHRLTVTEVKPNRVACRCACGSSTEVLLGNLRVTQSCGCRARENMARVAAARKLAPKDRAFNLLLYSYRNSCAKKRGLSFSLSQDAFKKLVSLPCRYCGRPPIQPKFYHGLDRVDNLVGYEPGNVVPCCQWCNRAKSDLPVGDFLRWARTVHGRRDDRFYPAYFPTGALDVLVSPTGRRFGRSAFRELYNSYKFKCALKRGLEFDISELQFAVLTSAPCRYCGAAPSQLAGREASYGRYLYNGLDRLNNSAGYTLDNVAPCCGHCNSAKSSQSVADFYAQVELVTASCGGDSAP